MTRLLAALLLYCACWIAHAEQTVLEVIALRYRPVEQVLPVLQPLVVPGGTVTGMNNQLIVRTTPKNLAELKEVLARIDTRPRRLMISVRQDADVDRESSGARPARVWRSDGSRAARIAQQVQVIEGGQAMIRIGESTPVRSRQYVGQAADGRAYAEAHEYRDTDRGFVVVPRLNGDDVTLELSAAADTLRSPRTGAVDVQRLQTTVSGRLGEWIEVAGIGDEAIERDSDILASSRAASRESRRVLLKVDEVR